MQWFASDKENGVTGYITLCALLDLDPAAGRRAAEKIREGATIREPVPDIYETTEAAGNPAPKAETETCIGSHG